MKNGLKVFKILTFPVPVLLFFVLTVEAYKLGWTDSQLTIVILACVLFVLIRGCWFIRSRIIKNIQIKNRTKVEATFESLGFSWQYHFSNDTGDYYIDEGGRLGVIKAGNPNVDIYDLAGITEICTDDGKELFGTRMVFCRFFLDGKRWKIYTFYRFGKKRYAMNHEEVLTAISKADAFCEKLRIAKENAIARNEK